MEEERIGNSRVFENEINKSQAMFEEEQTGESDQDEYCDLKEELLTYIQEAEQSKKTKTLLLQRNNNAATLRQNLADIAKRDSSVKKNSSFIKKLRNMGSGQVDSLIKECQSLNLSKYLSEAVAAIVEAKIKFTDIPSAVLLCTELNCTYPDFATFLQEEYIKVLTINKEEPIANANRLRVELCFYAELSICGVIPQRQSLPVLGTALTILTSDKTFNTLSMILSFCKHCGPDFAGLMPRRIRLLCDQFGERLSTSILLTPSKQESVRNLLQDYYLSLCQHLHNEQVKLSTYEKQSRQILMAKGEVRPDRVTNAEVMRTEIQSFLSGAVTLAEMLDVELPDLPDTDLQDLHLGDGDDCSGAHVWDDEETRLFYTDIPNVKDYVTQLNNLEETEDKNVSKALKTDDSENVSKKAGLDTFLKLLPDCRSKEMIDNAALEFLLYFNSKSGRKKLTVTLFMVPRNKLELLAFYARFIAILNPVIPEVANTICQQLKSEMLRHIHKKDQVNVESKKKTVKFIGELVNFGVYAKKEALRALKLLFYDFTHHNIEMTCSLLETCGIVLYAASDTHLSTKYHLEQMMRLKTMMALDSRYVNLIENTYYHILPPDSTSFPATMQLTSMQKCINNSVCQDLMQPGSDMSVLNLLRSLDWDCEETASYTIKCLTDAFNVGFIRVRSLASIVSMLANYQEDAVCRVVDGVLEDIRLGMEINEASMNQRRVAMIKYLGELYNYRILDSSDILRVLYSLISYGVTQEQNTVSMVDPPNSVMRIHLVLLLLTTCAFPLSSEETVTKLKYFFIYFQRYYWFKKSSSVWTEEYPFPRDIIYRYEDVLLSLCSDFKLAENLEAATVTANNLNSKMYSDAANDNPNIASFLGTVFEDNESNSEEETKSDECKETPENKKAANSSARKKEEADEEFLHELNKMVSESMKGVEPNSIKPNTEIAVPLNYKKALPADDKHKFVLLLKKGNKQTYKTLTLPPDHEFLKNLKSQEEACKQEKERVKRLTLDINERLQDDV